MSTQTFLPTATVRAKPARRAKLRGAVDRGTTIELRDSNGARIAAPELTYLLQLALDGLASGSDIVLLTSDSELSPNETGKMLGLSRQYVDRLIDLGELPARKLPGSSHRRIRVADIVAFQELRTHRRARIADAVNTLTDAGADY